MRQKAALLLSVIFILTITLLYTPQTAYAWGPIIDTGGTYDIAALYNCGVTVTIDTSDEVKLTGSNNIKVVCNAGTDLVLSDVTINVSGTIGACAIAFTGTGNTLELLGTNILKSGNNCAGIGVWDTTSLTINGSGSIDATGGNQAAGIGAPNFNDGGTITINSGEVTATGGNQAAGIGGGKAGDGGNITIAGGTVTAAGGQFGAGIGGGNTGNGGTITMSGGNTFAEKGLGSTYDIGSGYDTIGGTLAISGDAGVFLKNDASIASSTATHTHYPMATVISGKLYNVNAPAGWTQGSAYLVKRTLSYDNNGATGSVVADTIHSNGTVVVKTKGNLVNGTATFKYWNTMANEAGTSYNPGAEITLTTDMTLYAIWNHPATPTPIPTATPAPTATPTASDATASPAVTSAATTTKPKTISKTITATPTPLATAAPTTSGEQVATPAPELTATPEPSEETKVVVPAEIISEDDGDGNVTVQINRNDLPEGTTAISTPSGEVIAFGDAETIQITVAKDELGDDGALELVVLNDENVAFGAVDVQIAAQAAPVINVPKEAPKPINIVLWIIGGIALVAVVLAAIYIIQARIRFG